jgi:hypothetical protein
MPTPPKPPNSPPPGAKPPTGPPPRPPSAPQPHKDEQHSVAVEKGHPPPPLHERDGDQPVAARGTPRDIKPGDDPQETKMRIGEENLAAYARMARQEGQMTIADEQRARSEEMAREGVEKWKERHDQRSEEDRQSRPVTGVGTHGDARTLEPGSGASRR